MPQWTGMLKENIARIQFIIINFVHYALCRNPSPLKLCMLSVVTIYSSITWVTGNKTKTVIQLSLRAPIKFEKLLRGKVWILKRNRNNGNQFLDELLNSTFSFSIAETRNIFLKLIRQYIGSQVSTKVGAMTTTGHTVVCSYAV